MARRPPWRRIRSAAVIVIAVPAAGFLLHGCPSIRDGMAGQLAQAQKESESAVTTGSLALDLWRNHKSTNQLAAVQLSDAGDEVTKAYKGIATLTADNAADLRQQRTLTAAMTDAITALNAAGALVRGVGTDDSPDAARQRLIAAVAQLQSANS
jgi:hypothetical protein